MDDESDSCDLSFQGLNSLNYSKQSKTPYTDAVKCKKLVNHVKRPMNAFMIWSQMERRKIMEQNPNIQSADVSVQLGKRWKELSNQERIPFGREAERLRVLHSQEFPNYKFSPKPKKKKNQQSDTNSLDKKKEIDPKGKSRPVPYNKRIADTLENVSGMNPKSNSECNSTVFSNDKKFEKIHLQTAGTSNECIPQKIRKREKYPNITTEGKHVWDSLKKIKITSLAIDKSDSINIGESDSISQQLKPSSSSKIPLPPRLHIDNCLTSGSIAALAYYRDDWSAVFDYLTDKVLQNSKNIYDEIDNISKQYCEAVEENIQYPTEPPELNLPEISKVLGKRWKDPNFGLKFSS